MGTYQAKNSEFNKDANFARFGIDNTVKLTLSEAIAKDVDENKLEVFGWCEPTPTGINKFGDITWVFEPELVRFLIPKKDFSNTYQGKTKETKCSSGMKLAVHLITQYGFDKPFSARFDFGVADEVAEALITGKRSGGVEVSEMELKFMRDMFCDLTPLEKLTKLEGVEITASSSKGGGFKGKPLQTELEKLSDRVKFLNEQLADGSELQKLLAGIDALGDSDTRKIIFTGLIERLF